MVCFSKFGALSVCVFRGERGGFGFLVSYRRFSYRSLRGDALFFFGIEIDRGLLLDGRGKEVGSEESEGRSEESERGSEGFFVGFSRV